MLQTAFRLLVDEGPAELTPVRIHRETGVARTTVYRHWPTPAHLVEAILSVAVARHELDDLVGDLDHDLTVALATLLVRFREPPLPVFFDAVRLHGDPAESPTMGERYIAGLIAPVHDVIRSAIDRGELHPEPPPDPDELTAELCGPLLLNHLLLGRDVDPDAVERARLVFLRRHSRRAVIEPSRG